MGKWHATHQGVWMREAPGVSAMRFGAAGGLGRGVCSVLRHTGVR